MDKILVPLDGSTDSEQVLANLRMILRTGLHELVVLRVAAMPVSDVHFPIPVVELREEAERYVKAVCTRLGTEGVHATGHAVVGDAGSEILRCAAEQGVSLIAMSTHGRSGLSRLALGSVAEHVLRRADVPVWLVKPGQEGPITIRTILVPLDGSERSATIVPVAADVAKWFGARIVLLHAFEKKKEPQELRPPQMPLKAPEARLREAGVEVKTDFLQGDPADAILEAARESGADLIALSSHGRTGLARLVLGSVAERVVRAAPLPVLVLRAGAAQFVKGASHA
jgi:nucleotide-binding universal stress UspA family protein